MSRATVSVLLLLLVLVAREKSLASRSNPRGVIEIPSYDERSFTELNKWVRPRYLYKRYQESEYYIIASSTTVFAKVPGLSVAVHHTVPMVYNIRVQISCELQNAGAHSLIRFLVNEKVLVSNKLFPNSDKRTQNQPVWSTNIFALDFRGGSLFYNSGTSGIVVPYFKSELFVLPPGTHVIDLGARTDKPILRLWGGELQVEITEYDPNLHVGFEYLITPNYD